MDVKHPTGRPVDDDAATDPLVLGVAAVRAMLVVRAVLAIAFGLVALFWPGLTVLALAIAFGIYAIVDGIATVVDAIGNRERSRWWLGLLGGVASLVAGVLALVWPGITALVLAVVVGIWAVITGVAQIATAIRLRSAGGRVWLIGVAGVLSVVAGILFMVWPGQGALGLALLFGVFAIVYGVVIGALAVSLRSSVP
jgi:uncharacterized membrane protein HdeD (DUF308 family)